MGEEWRDILGFEGVFMISNLGRAKRLPGLSIRSVSGRNHLRNTKGGLLKGRATPSGYIQFKLSVNGKVKMLSAHRAVAAAFVERSPGRDVVNHKNGDRGDNRAENLEWVTISENMLHSYRELGRFCHRGQTHFKTTLTEEDVLYIRANSGDINQRKMLAKKFGVSTASIYDITTRKRWRHL